MDITPSQSAALEAVGIGIVVIASLVLGLFSGFIGALIGATKNRKGLGLCLGIIFGPLGWLFVLFAQDGDRDEGFATMFGAFAMAAMVNACIASVLWFGVFRPLVQRSAAIAAEQRAEQQKAHEKRMEELERELNPPEPPEPVPVVDPRPTAPIYTGQNPAPIPVPRRLTPAEQNAEIARKYGAPR